MENGGEEVGCCVMEVSPALLGRSSVPVIAAPPLSRTGRVGGVEMWGGMSLVLVCLGMGGIVGI